MTEIICDTLIEFLDRLAIKRGHNLYPQNSSYRQMIGFIDAETGEWVLTLQGVIQDADRKNADLKKACVRLGKSSEEVIKLLQTPFGVRTLFKSN